VKYSRPDFHFISAANAAAECVHGTTASIDGTCDLGPIVLSGPCQLGSVAVGNCKTGTCATNCVSFGSDVDGNGCCGGTIVT
jgi:hypothetical protein